MLCALTKLVVVVARFSGKKRMIVYMSKCECRFPGGNAGPTFCTLGVGNVNLFEERWNHATQVMWHWAEYK